MQEENVQPTQEQPAPQAAPQATPQAAPEFTPGIATSQPTPEPQPAPQPEATQEQPAKQEEAPAPQGESQNIKPIEQPSQIDYDAYLRNALEQNDPSKIEVPNIPTQEQLETNDNALKEYFDGLIDTAVKRSTVEQSRQAAIREAETQAWNEVFTKYPEIKESKGLRDTIHNIRIGAYQRGQSLSPAQVADQLVGDLHNQYKQGVNDTNVQTTVRQSQPVGGGSQPPASPSVDYKKLQDGGQNAAIDELTKLIDAGLI